MSSITICATGDAFMTRPVPEVYQGFRELRETILSCDVRFNNLEFTAHDQEGAPAAVSGGTWAMSEPGILDELGKFGFNIYNTANNHSLDYGEGGLLATLRHMAERSMTACGTGETLREASRPRYVELEGRRVGFIGVSASFSAFHPAGDPTDPVRGRPGLNPLGKEKIYHVTAPEMAMLRQIARKTHMNAPEEFEIANGYMAPPPEGFFRFGGLTFRLDEDTFTESRPKKRDVQRVLDAVREAKREAELVFVSLHNHAYDGEDPALPPQFVRDFAHAVIDGGADGLIGHGPHILSGIEIYNGKPIFYSLGDFIFQTETVRVQPGEAYTNMGLPADSSVRELMLLRSHNDTTGYAAMTDIWRSVTARFRMEDGVLRELRLDPITLGMGRPWQERGWPHLDRNEETLRHLAALSAPFGTEIELRDGAGYVKL